ncbi:hypothetical protein [Microbacterium murale]|uniref:YtxH domain-containing protein n=1 Tax=Microbacterium murale TaxID=1081040 RepID=A0ABU0P7V6_9MICO|nr:hypothetical protein [Microbacterium murale]MDQ0642982.1 hypothetical protein [Microbacterium murale]
MKGKIGLVVGLGVGYVLGTRAGRERYEQIKKQWLKVWHLDPVQDQVTKLTAFAGDKAAAIPGAVWSGIVKVAKSAGNGTTPGEKLDSAIATTKKAAENVAEVAEGVVEDAKTAAKTPAAKKPAASSASTASTAKKTSTNGK